MAAWQRWHRPGRGRRLDLMNLSAVQSRADSFGFSPGLHKRHRQSSSDKKTILGTAAATKSLRGTEGGGAAEFLLDAGETAEAIGRLTTIRGSMIFTASFRFYLPMCIIAGEFGSRQVDPYPRRRRRRGRLPTGPSSRSSTPGAKWSREPTSRNRRVRRHRFDRPAVPFAGWAQGLVRRA